MLRPAAVAAALAAALLAAPMTAAMTALMAAGPAYAEPGRPGDGWALDAINAEQAWTVTKGSGVTVALLGAQRPDEQIPELKGKVTQGPDMTGTFFDQDIAQPGDDATAAASLIARVAPEARLLSVPIAERRPDGVSVDPQDEIGGPQDSPIARGIRYAVNQGVAVICVPVADYGVDRADREAVTYALSRGVVLVAAVGDGGRSQYAQQAGTSYWGFPAGYPGVIGVGAVDEHGRKSGFSSDNLSVAVAAPGTEVPVTMPGGTSGTASGTGLSSALVAGTAALIKAKYPDMAPDLVSRALTSTSRPHPRAGYDEKVGFGVIDAAGALAKAGQLTGYGRAAPVQDDLHFGKGSLSEGPVRPGPDPVRLWIYGIAAFFGLGGFCAAIVALSRR